MQSSQRCILAVGDTGNGKSFTATVFGAKNVIVGHTSESETKKITIYDIEKGGFYIDTPGFDDSDEDRSDGDTIHNIYLEMLEKNIQNVTTILWFVVPDDKAKASYKRQARFIESLAKYYNGNVWDNTIIVSKGERIEEGPRDAAREVAKITKQVNDDLLLKARDFKIFLFEKLKLPSIFVDRTYTSDELNKHGIFKESEPERILAKYESLMEGHLTHPIRLDLKKVKCSKCSEETDPRFASPKCHDIELVHPSTKREHWGNVADIHPASLFYKHISGYVAGTTKTETDGIFGITLRSKTETTPGYWICCGNNDVNSQGCKLFYRCCEKENLSLGCRKIYNVCGHEISVAPCITVCDHCKRTSDTTGCREKCRNCQNYNPSNIKGCIETSHKFG